MRGSGRENMFLFVRRVSLVCLLCLLCLVCLVIIYGQEPRYISWLPSVPLYPSNIEDAYLVKSYTDKRTRYYTELFTLTDPSVSHAFLPYVKESLSTLNDLIMSPHILLIVYGTKYLCNRARPIQVLPTIDQLESKTADTPAYPSGHAFQAYYLARILSQRYPHLSNKFQRIAEDCALARVYAGLHYPSDNRFSKELVTLLF
jgi:membrane-associated phospholipid phosphatase